MTLSTKDCKWASITRLNDTDCIHLRVKGNFPSPLLSTKIEEKQKPLFHSVVNKVEKEKEKRF